MESIPTYEVPVNGTPEGRRGQNHPAAVLIVQHQSALDAVRKLDDAARSIREKGFTAAAFESTVVAASFLDEYFRKQEALAERHLLPVIEMTDPLEAKAFWEEHRVIRNLLAGLLALVAEIEGGRIRGSSVGDLLRTATLLVTHLRKNIIHQIDESHYQRQPSSHTENRNVSNETRR